MIADAVQFRKSICHFSGPMTSAGALTCNGKRHGAAPPPETEVGANNEREDVQDAPACLALQDTGHSTPGLKHERVKQEVVNTEVAQHDVEEEPPA